MTKNALIRIKYHVYSQIEIKYLFKKNDNKKIISDCQGVIFR